MLAPSTQSGAAAGERWGRGKDLHRHLWGIGVCFSRLYPGIPRNFPGFRATCAQLDDLEDLCFARQGQLKANVSVEVELLLTGSHLWVVAVQVADAGQLDAQRRSIELQLPENSLRRVS